MSNNQDADELLARANVLVTEDRCEEAIELYNKAIDLTPNDPWLFSYRAAGMLLIMMNTNDD
jgi:tetratricopeptide (TPR) repeat protein